MLRIRWTSQAIDDVLAGTFPASDPPAWTPGMARPAPAVAAREAAEDTAEDATSHVRSSDAIDLSRATDAERTVGQLLVSLLGAAGLAVLFALAILAVGTPVALAVRGLLEVAQALLR